MSMAIGYDLGRELERRPTRAERLLPNGVPRYVRCYRRDDGTFDPYTIVFTSKRGGFYIAANGDPKRFYHRGEGRTDSGQRFLLPEDWKTATYMRPPAIGRSNHLGKRVKFESLPLKLQAAILTEYTTLWQIQ